MKDVFCRKSCKNVTKLKRRITTAVRIISGDVLGYVWKNVKELLEAVTKEDGGHIENL